MDSNVVHPYELQIRQVLDKILPNAYDSIEKIEKLPPKTGLRILAILTKFACKSQNLSLIMLARERIKKMPLEWLFQYFPEAAYESVCFEDEWEYRRLLELVQETVPQLLEVFINQGASSKNEEIREVIEDFLNK